MAGSFNHRAGGYEDIRLAILPRGGRIGGYLAGHRSLGVGSACSSPGVVSRCCRSLGVSVVVDVAAPVLCSPLGVGVLSGQAASCLLIVFW